MSDWDAAEYVTQVVATASTSGHSVHAGALWVSVRPEGVPLAEAGWKLHISSRAATFPDLLEKLLPVLLEERCHFKLARSRQTLARLNEGVDSPTSVGKAVTIYPEQHRVRDLGESLAKLLSGHEGPRVLSDRRVDPNAPVYYRYGPFTAQWHVGRHGYLGIGIAGPDGDVFDGLATLEYRQPSWVVDPFTPDDSADNAANTAADTAADTAAAGHPETSPLLGERYRATQGIYQSAHGNVYRATDERTGRSVIVKQARALVGETADGQDARLRLRNERRILEACRDVTGVPRVVDHFAHGADEFLVTDDVGETNLLHDVQLNGCRLPPGVEAPPERFVGTVRQLARTVAELHDRGIVMRDITPRNVVVNDDRAFLIDFGLAAMDGIHLKGGTPGFAPKRQLRDETPRPGDDCYALGMVLVFVAAGRLPIPYVADDDLARLRTLQALRSIYADQHHGFVSLVADLISPDEVRADAALRALAAGELWTDRTDPVPVTPPAVPDPVSVEKRVLDLVLDHIDEYQLSDASDGFPSIDASVYTGSAGIGLELLHHLERDGVPEVVQRLVNHAVKASRAVNRERGLFTGSTGVELFLQRATAAGFDAASPLTDTERRIPGPEQLDELGDDVMGGVAGLGLAQLYLYDVTGDQAHLEVARRCVEHAVSRPQMRMSVEDHHLLKTSGSDQAHGYAHGLAGLLDCLIAYAVRTGDEQITEEARVRADRLRTRAAELIVIAQDPLKAPVAAGWCKGLAGISRTLLHAGTALGDAECTRTAESALTVAAGWIPRMENLSQCCGAAGLGSALLEGFRTTGTARHRDAADRVVSQLFVRSGRPDDAPVFIEPRAQDAPLSWGMGMTGILTFLRQLNASEQPDIFPAVVPASST